jgi:hypothetical protein
VPWPSDDELLAAWRRLADDPDAGAAFLALALRPLAEALAELFPTTDPDVVESAVAVALLAFLKRHARYDPAKLRLPNFLRLIAKRKLLNELKGERKHRDGKIPWDSVEFDVGERNEEDEDDPPTFDAPELVPVIATLSETDRRILDLMRAGERRTAAFAAEMGIADRSADEQKAAVKRAKDRILARLRRAVGGSDG